MRCVTGLKPLRLPKPNFSVQWTKSVTALQQSAKSLVSNFAQDLGAMTSLQHLYVARLGLKDLPPLYCSDGF